MPKFLRLVGWDQYQHYKNRNPPWLKLHRSILQSPKYHKLDDAGKLLAFVCIVLAGDSNNMIPLDRDFIQSRGDLQKRPDIRPLVAAGFAEVVEIAEECEQFASNTPPKYVSETYKEETYKQETEKETESQTDKLLSKIGVDEATQKVFIEVSLAGNEARMLVHDAVNACVHSKKCTFAEAADFLIAGWQEYEAAPIEFKKGVFKFFKEGLWKGNWKTATKSEDWAEGYEKRKAAATK